MSQAIAITAVGMVTGVGLNAPASCAAIRCGIDNFQETRFMDDSGEWIMGCSVPLEQPWRGKTKLIKMAAAAIQECLDQKTHINTQETPLILCLPETNRPGRVFSDDNAFFLDLQKELDQQFHPKSRVIALGRVSIGVALQRARLLIHTNIAKQVIIAGTDSLLVGATLAEFQEREYLLTSNNSDGFIPAEAGAALIVEAVSKQAEAQLIFTGLGFGTETAHVDSEQPLRASGLTTAIKAALEEANCEMHDMDFRITDVSGKQYYFKEASLALSRTLRQRKKEFDIWHPADCVGEIGVTIGFIMFAVIKTACEKNYSKGHHILVHAGDNDGKRTAIITTWKIIGNKN
jgi:3-oxoacyl-[acyl-carrier-protein] synthase-1